MADISSWIFLALGLLGGFIISLLLWWIMNHFFVPDLQFSKEISVSDAKFLESGKRYQIAFKNCGKRDALNVRFRCRMKIKDILNSGGKLWDYMNISLAGDDFYILKKGSMFRLTPRLELTKYFQSPIFSDSIREKSIDKKLTFEDIFQEYSDVKIFIEAIGVDSISGGTKYFRSKEYTRFDFRNGVFHGKKHLQIHKQTSKLIT